MSDSHQIPVVDIGLERPLDPADRIAAARAIGAACASGGFFAVTGHGVPAATIDAAYQAAARFFAQPDEAKTALGADSLDPLQRGYVRGELETYSFSRMGELSAGQESRGGPIVMLPNRWPAALDDFRKPCLDYYAAVEKVALEVVRMFALALDLPENWLSDKFDKHVTQLAMNHYEPDEVAFAGREFRNDQHQDWGTMTLLYQGDPNGGLQIRDESGTWVDIPPSTDQFVVHCGDLMSRWTNGRWVSAVHRVRRATSEFANKDHISLAFFFEPNPDVIIECIPTCATESEPAKFPPGRAHDYLSAKVRRAFIASKVAKPTRAAS